MYVVSQDANRMDRFDPQTGEVEMFEVPGLKPEDGPSLVFLSPGPDDTSLWFSEFLNNQVGRFRPHHREVHGVSPFGISGGSAPIGIFHEFYDNNIWFTEAVPRHAIPIGVGHIIP